MSRCARTFLSSVGAGVAATAADAAGWDELADRERERAEARAFAGSDDGIARFGRAEVVWSVPTSRPRIALTFDDGPDPRYTPRILEELERAGVAATFDMMGRNVERHPDLAREVIAAGHEVGNHGSTHLDLSGADPIEAAAEIVDGKDALASIGVERVRWFRPARGNLTGAVVRAATESGHDVLMWSVDGRARRGESPEAYARRLIPTVRRGDIVVLRDGVGRGTFFPGTDWAADLQDKRETEIAALGDLLEGLSDAGIAVVTAGELIATADG